MTEFFLMVIKIITGAFSLLNVIVFGVPLYTVFVFLFVMGSLADFLHGRKR